MAAAAEPTPSLRAAVVSKVKPRIHSNNVWEA
jgi:hypothetical protein